MKLISTTLLRRAGLFAMACAVSALSWGQVDRSKAPEAGPAPELKIGTPTKLKLDNGLQVIVVENHRMPAVTWSMTLDYPPFLEGNKAGLTSIVSDMMGSGTEQRTKAQIAEEVEFLGASFRSSATGFFASSLSKHTGDLLRIVSDAILNPTFPEEELEKVKKQVSSGLANTPTSPGDIASNLVAATNFGALHPYGEVMTEESLNEIRRDDLVKYHKTYFRPNVSYLIVVGDITPDEAYAKANAHFGKWFRGDIPYTRIMPAKFPTGNQVRFAGIDGAVQSTINITQPVPFPPGHPDAAAIQLMNSILGGGAFSGRLMQNLREDKAYTYGARSSLSADPVTAQFSAFANVRTEVTDSALVEFMAEINRIRDTKVDSAELATAKAFMSGSFARSLENEGTVARFALNIERYGLPDDYYQTYLQRLEAVTVEDIQRVAQNMLKPKNLNICVVGSPDILDKLRAFDAGGGIDQYDPFGRVRIPRTDAPAGTTVEGVVNRHFDAIGGAKAWSKLTGLTTTGSVEFGGGMSLQHSESKRFSKKDPAIRTELAMAGQAVMIRAISGSQGQELQMGATSDMDVATVATMLDYHSPIRLTRMEKNGYSASVLGQEEVAGQMCTVLEFTKGEAVETYWFRAEDGLLIQQRRPALDGTMATESMDQYLAFGDNGLKLPATKSSTVAGQSMIVRIAAATFNPEFAANAFALQP
ncbi:MAG: pitrilysin family protein [Bacteroidetes bacterium]|nr:pitrilysin family protein [Bacteroidota bacterium]